MDPVLGVTIDRRITVRIALSEALCYSHGHVRIAPCYLHVTVRIALCYSHVTVRIATALYNNPGVIHPLQYWRHYYRAITASTALPYKSDDTSACTNQLEYTYDTRVSVRA